MERDEEKKQTDRQIEKETEKQAKSHLLKFGNIYAAGCAQGRRKQPDRQRDKQRDRETGKKPSAKIWQHLRGCLCTGTKKTARQTNR